MGRKASFSSPFSTPSFQKHLYKDPINNLLMQNHMHINPKTLIPILMIIIKHTWTWEIFGTISMYHTNTLSA